MARRSNLPICLGAVDLPLIYRAPSIPDGLSHARNAWLSLSLSLYVKRVSYKISITRGLFVVGKLE